MQIQSVHSGRTGTDGRIAVRTELDLDPVVLHRQVAPTQRPVQLVQQLRAVTQRVVQPRTGLQHVPYVLRGPPLDPGAVLQQVTGALRIDGLQYDQPVVRLVEPGHRELARPSTAAGLPGQHAMSGIPNRPPAHAGQRPGERPCRPDVQHSATRGPRGPRPPAGRPRPVSRDRRMLQSEPVQRPVGQSFVLRYAQLVAQRIQRVAPEVVACGHRVVVPLMRVAYLVRRLVRGVRLGRPSTACAVGRLAPVGQRIGHRCRVCSERSWKPCSVRYAPGWSASWCSGRPIRCGTCRAGHRRRAAGRRHRGTGPAGRSARAAARPGHGAFPNAACRCRGTNPPPEGPG